MRKRISGYEKYEIDTSGNVYSLCWAVDRVLNPTLRDDGYYTVNLSMNGKSKNHLVHRLVAITFIKNSDDNKNCINHIDGNKANNSIDNLEWVTHKENTAHALDNDLIKTGEKSKISKLTNDDCNKIETLYVELGFSLKQIAARYKVCERTIRRVINNETYRDRSN